MCVCVCVCVKWIKEVIWLGNNSAEGGEVRSAVLIRSLISFSRRSCSQPGQRRGKS